MEPHRAKKRLGQHFLKSPKALSAMCAAAELTKSDRVLEIGPGKGILTHALLDTGAHVVAVEKDTDLLPLLHETFAKEIASHQLTIVHDDVRSFVPEIYGLTVGTYKLIANIPYYITGEIIEMFLEHKAQPSTMILLIQKEVADRIVARDGKESVLSIAVKAYGTPKIIQKVPRQFFSPTPKVDSAIIAIQHISHERFEKISDRDFFILLKIGFSQKRKKLAGNISSLISKERFTSWCEANSVSPDIRPEDLSVEHWFSLAKIR